MVTAVTTRVVGCSADAFLAFVLDVERYREVDNKIGPIDWVRTEGLVTEFRFRPTLPGLPFAPKVVSRMRLTPGRRIDIEHSPLPQNRLAHRMSTFAASFECEPVEGGTRVTRRVSIGIPRLFRALERPLLRRGLQRSVERELDLSQSRTW
jgi:hypothetical protein